MRRPILTVVIVIASVFYMQTAISQTIPLAEWQTLVALYRSTHGHSWYSGWKVTGKGPDGSECSWYGVTCDATPHVTELYLRNNHLVGPLPDLTGLPSLSVLILGENHITGPLPISIANLSQLTRLEVEYNYLTGTIDVLAGLAKLDEFDGDQNTFTGSIPNFMGMPSLREFSVANNQFTGQTPQLDNNTDWNYFNIEDNYLSGVVPAIANQHFLQVFAISGNRLTGVMPPPPDPALLSPIVILCPGNNFAPLDDTGWDSLTGTTPWYTQCDTNTIFNDGFGAPPSMQ